MPDIQMRFNKDMLVLSTPLDYQLASQGFDPSDREYVVLCEPELIEEAFKLEKSIDGAGSHIQGVAQGADVSNGYGEDRKPQQEKNYQRRFFT